jgi:hypothetical protein
MKRIALVAALLGAFIFAFAGVATAGGNGTQVTHYDTAYVDSFFGPVHCTGVNQVKNLKPTQESFTCISTSGAPLANVSPGQTINWGPGTWLSDYDKVTLDQSFNATVSADGMSYSAVATY